MKLKKITSLTMLLSMLAMVYTGIILFITPPGRVANWANWELLGLTKEQYGQIHSTFMVLFLIATVLHIYYNWTPMISYMKNKTKELIIFTKDMLVAVLLFLAFLFGTIYEVSPFSNFLSFGEEIKESWEKDYGTAPYSHAELSSLKSFSSKLGFDLNEVNSVLKANNLIYQEEQSLAQIAKVNKVSPNFIYDLLRVHFEKQGKKIIPLTGLGKKSVKDVAITIGISTEEFILQLETLGIEAKQSDKFKAVTEQNDLSPMDVMEQLGYKKD